MFLSRSKFNSGEREGRSEMIYILFLHNLVHFQKAFLIRAVSPATPQGSVSQAHVLKNYPPYISSFNFTHTRTHTNTHALTFILPLFWHLIPEGKQLKEAISPTLLNPLQLPMSPLPEVLSRSRPASPPPLSWQVIRWCHRPKGVWRPSNRMPWQPLREFCQHCFSSSLETSGLFLIQIASANWQKNLLL